MAPLQGGAKTMEHPMIPLTTHRLPDPTRHAAFYDGVPAKRALAWVIDAVIAGIVTAIIVPFTVFVALLFLPALFLVVSFLYRWATIANGSATLGMRLMGVQLLDSDGHDLTSATAFGHTFIYTVCMAMVIPQLVSIVLMATDARGKGLGDLALGTVMINRPAV
jgi:uncharacterized RDD family membrane protein YckC